MLVPWDMPPPANRPLPHSSFRGGGSKPLTLTGKAVGNDSKFPREAAGALPVRSQSELILFFHDEN